MGERERGGAGEKKGYGTLRYNLFLRADVHIQNSITNGYFCEAITIVESIISDRLESRLSFLSERNIGFKTLGWLTKELLKIEKDEEIIYVLKLIDKWRVKRNGALHEMVKVERGKTNKGWDERVAELYDDAETGYDLMKWIYWRVAELNPNHLDRAFGRPKNRNFKT